MILFKFYFNWDKKDSISFLDKYHAKTYGTLKSFGKYVNNGFLVLDKTGKVSTNETLKKKKEYFV